MKTKKILFAFLFAFVGIILASCGHEHTYATEWSKDATHHWHAATCEHAEEVADKAEHAWNEGEVTTEATIDAEGVMTYTCSECGQTKTESIAKLPHDHTFATEWSKNETHHWHAATCTHTSEVADKAEHTWNEGEVTTEPTEEAAGVKTFACTECGQTKTEEVEKLPHTHKYADTWTYDEDYHWHAATCGHEDAYSDLAEHVWGEGEVTKVPTCDELGEKTFTCACGATKKEPVQKDINAHSFAETLTYDETHHWYAATCSHKNEVSGKVLHTYDEGKVTTEPTYYEEGVKTFTCECGHTYTESVPVLKNYEDPNWTSMVENGYYYLDGAIISNVNQDLTESAEFPWFNYDAVNYNLYNTEQGMNYTVSLDIKGTVASLNHTTLLAGAVVWYQDADNYIVFGAHWAEKDRPGDIRSFWFKGQVGGTTFSSGDWWCDNSAILPADGIKVTVTKLKDTFTFEAYNASGAKIKDGFVLISGTDTQTSKVGVVGLNDAFSFTNFEVEKYVPAPTVYTAEVDGATHELALSNVDNSFVLTQGSKELKGTYETVGREVTLTLEDNSVVVVKVTTDGKFSYVEEEVEEVAYVKVEPGNNVVVSENLLGDYEISLDVMGIVASITGEVQFKFYAWYVDENNYVEVFVEWQTWDRSFEIRSIQTSGKINGTTFAGNENWGDNPNNNTLPADGFKLVVKKAGNVISHTLTCPSGVTKSKTVTINGLDTSKQYSIQMGALGDTFKVSNIVFTPVVVSDNVEVLAEGLTGDYNVTYNVSGLVTAITAEVHFKFYAWYVDENNYVEIYAEWQTWDRSFEIRSIQTSGKINGTTFAGNENWGDNPNNNTLPVDGFVFNVIKTGNEFKHVLTCPNGVVKSKTVTVGIDTSLPYSVKVGALGDTFTVNRIITAEYEEVVDTSVKVTPAENVVLYDNMNGDYEITLDVMGIVASITGEVHFKFYAWYVDENNYVEVYVEWQTWDRSFEIRSIQTSGKINGTSFAGNENWGDNPNNNTLPADGFKLVVKKAGNVISHTLTCSNGVAKSKSVTINGLDTSVAYSVKLGALGDTFTVDNVVLNQ